MHQLYFIILISLMTIPGFSQQNDIQKALTPDRAKELESALQQMYERQQFNGTLLLAEEGEIVFEKVLGISNINTGEPLQSNSSYRLASVSKQFIAMGIMILAEKGKLSYEDDIQTFFPELPYKGITVRHLLHHTGGLTDYMDLFVEHWDTEQELEDRQIAYNEDMVKLFAEHQPKIDFEGGEKYEYSNTGYVLLGSIIERVSKQSIHDFMYENVFQVAGMTNTRAFKAEGDFGIKNRVYGFIQVDENETEMNDHNFLNGMVGDGGIYATAQDLLAWDRALKTEKLVSQQTLRTAFTSGVLNDGSSTGYGFGWGVVYDDNGNTKQVSHGGSWVGFRTFIGRDLKDDRTLILLTNNSDNQMSRIVKIATNIWKGEDYELPEEKIAIELAPEVMKQYVGVYELAPGFNITITVEDDRMFGQPTGQGKLELFPSSETEFFLRVVDASVTFNKNAVGEVESMTLHQGGDQVGKKIE
ncbi:MAG: serine hydrolase [Bacteroidota bacterium]